MKQRLMSFLQQPQPLFHGDAAVLVLSKKVVVIRLNVPVFGNFVLFGQ